MSKRMTAAFELDVRTLGVNPFKVETPFGPPVTVSDGDEFERADALEARIAELEDALRGLTDGYGYCGTTQAGDGQCVYCNALDFEPHGENCDYVRARNLLTQNSPSPPLKIA